MHKIATPLAYTSPSGTPVLSQRYVLTDKEAEVTEVRDLIVAEGVATPGKAGMLALAALPDPDPAFVEWSTCGLLVHTEHGYDFADPAVAAWALSVAQTGKVW